MPFDDNNRPYRNTCKDCEYERYCPFERRNKMFSRKCYVDYIAEKMNITPKVFLKRCWNYVVKYESDFPDINIYMELESERSCWLEMSNREREEYIADDFKWWLKKIGKSENDYRKSEGQLYAAMINTYLNCWNNEEYIKCARCGEVIKNSKQRNRRFCEFCIGYQRKYIDYSICVECGEEFEKETNNQYRCYLCQKEADKAAARERARRYRERKNHGSDYKS